MSWRRVDEQEVEDARSEGFVWTRDPVVVAAALDRATERWHGPTTVVLEDGVFRFEGTPQRQVGLGSVRSVAQRRRVVWVQSHNAPDWLVRCLSERDAVSLAEAIRAGAAVA